MGNDSDCQRAHAAWPQLNVSAPSSYLRRARLRPAGRTLPYALPLLCASIHRRNGVLGAEGRERGRVAVQSPRVFHASRNLFLGVVVRVCVCVNAPITCSRQRNATALRVVCDVIIVIIRAMGDAFTTASAAINPLGTRIAGIHTHTYALI